MSYLWRNWNIIKFRNHSPESFCQRSLIDIRWRGNLGSKRISENCQTSFRWEGTKSRYSKYFIQLNDLRFQKILDYQLLIAKSITSRNSYLLSANALFWSSIFLLCTYFLEALSLFDFVHIWDLFVYTNRVISGFYLTNCFLVL